MNHISIVISHGFNHIKWQHSLNAFQTLGCHLKSLSCFYTLELKNLKAWFTSFNQCWMLLWDWSILVGDLQRFIFFEVPADACAGDSKNSIHIHAKLVGFSQHKNLLSINYPCRSFHWTQSFLLQVHSLPLPCFANYGSAVIPKRPF